MTSKFFFRALQRITGLYNMQNLQYLKNKFIISDIDMATLEKIYLAQDVAPTGIITRRYELTIATIDKNGKQAISRHYTARPLRAIEPASTKDAFIVYTKIGFKLPALIECNKLKQTFEKSIIFTPCIVDAWQAIQESNKTKWIDELRQTSKDKDATRAVEIIRAILRPDFITSKGEMIGIDWRFKESHNTINKLMQNIGIDPRQNAQFLSDMVALGHAHHIAGYKVRMIIDKDEISRIYAIQDGFDSCMTGLETPARIYQPYIDGKQSIALHVLEKEGEFIARFIVRLKSKKYPSLYTANNRDNVAHVLTSLGYEKNVSCLIGGRLPLVIDDSDNSIYMVYVDGDNKELRVIESEDGNAHYLQVGGTRGEYLGEGNDQRGKLRISNYARELGYTHGNGYKDTSAYYEDENEDAFYCECCQESGISNDQRNNIDGQLVCDYCLNNEYSHCEDCEEYTANDNANYVEVYNHQADETESTTLCECCLNDNYYLEPVKGNYYFHIESLKRYVLR